MLRAPVGLAAFARQADGTQARLAAIHSASGRGRRGALSVPRGCAVAPTWTARESGAVDRGSPAIRPRLGAARALTPGDQLQGAADERMDIQLQARSCGERGLLP